MAQMVKNLLLMRETQVRSLDQKIPWRRAWQPTLVFLPGESHGQKSLAGYSPWGHKESDTAEQLTHNTLLHFCHSSVPSLILSNTLNPSLILKAKRTLSLYDPITILRVAFPGPLQTRNGFQKKQANLKDRIIAPLPSKLSSKHLLLDTSPAYSL